MNKKTYDKLLKDYFSLNSPKETTAVKYTGVFNSIHIIIYFDAWDQENLNFQLIVHNNSEYYLTTLNRRCVKLKLKFLQKNCNFFRNKLKNIKRSDIEDKFIRIFLPPQITPL